MEEASVLIIIVTYNKKEFVSNLLESLNEIDYENFDTVVVDNASTDGTAEYLKENFSSITLICNSENIGGSGGFNTGLSHAFKKQGYKYYWLLDNDVIVAKNALRKLVETLEHNKDIAVAGSQMCQLDNPEVTNEIGAYVDFHSGCLVLNRHLTRKRNNPTGIFDVDYAAAASLLVKADIANKAGFWENFFIHFDDVEWCLRIKEMGYRIVGVADSVIWHLSASEKPITWAKYYDVRNMLFLLQNYATKKDVKRFARKKCLQALHTELKGITPVAGFILDAIEDFQNRVKGKKNFHFPENVSEEKLKDSHPEKDVVVFQSEWFDLEKFPFIDRYKDSIKEILLPDYLIDAELYWKRNGNMSVKRYGKLYKLPLILAGLLGYRKYKRAYVDIRNSSYITALLSNELVVKINETNWLIKRNRLSAWQSLFHIIKRSGKCFVQSI